MTVWKLTVTESTTFKHVPVPNASDISNDSYKADVLPGTTYLVVENQDDFPEHYHVTLPQGFLLKSLNEWYVYKPHATVETATWPSYS